MGEFSFWHILIILVIVLIFFGPSRLPGLGHSLGKAIRGFKDGMKDITSDDEKPAQQAREALPPKDETTDQNQNQKTKNTSNS